MNASTTPQAIWRDTNLLGEGPHWSVREQALYWVDIHGSTLHRLDPVTGAHQAWKLVVRPSAIAEHHEGGLLLATEDGLRRFDPESGELGSAVTLEYDRPANRTNDGKCDPQGRFWIGTMSESDDPDAPSGALYRVDVDGSTTRVLDDIAIPNTFAWSADGHSMYFGDSGQQTLYRFRFDPATGTLSERESFITTRGQAATPDGSCIDEAGYLWNCQWDGGRVVRYAPDGSIDRIVEMPVSRPTSCCFGGPGLDTLFVTSARGELNDDALTKEPLAGSLFAFKPGVRGPAPTDFGPRP